MDTSSMYIERLEQAVCVMGPAFRRRSMQLRHQRSCGSHGAWSRGLHPFLLSRYPVRFADGHEKATVADAITGLKRAIDLFKVCRGEAAVS